jgi:hypothetical protein
MIIAGSSTSYADLPFAFSGQGSAPARSQEEPLFKARDPSSVRQRGRSSGLARRSGSGWVKRANPHRLSAGWLLRASRRRESWSKPPRRGTPCWSTIGPGPAAEPAVGPVRSGDPRRRAKPVRQDRAASLFRFPARAGTAAGTDERSGRIRRAGLWTDQHGRWPYRAGPSQPEPGRTARRPGGPATHGQTRPDPTALGARPRRESCPLCPTVAMIEVCPRAFPAPAEGSGIVEA